MRHSHPGSFREQANFLRRQFLQDGHLPFTNVLSQEVVEQALSASNTSWLDRIFSPLVTLWVFLGQVLSADHSCRAAVARLIAPRLSRGQSPCSAETGACCQARKRLPEKFVADIARGQVVGSTDAKGYDVKEARVTPSDLAATVYRHLGIALDSQWTDSQGRPQAIVTEGGRPIPALST
jgi:Protein of unknown function (DUF1501)